MEIHLETFLSVFGLNHMDPRDGRNTDTTTKSQSLPPKYETENVAVQSVGLH